MLALLGFVIKYKRDREGKELSLADKIPMVGSVVFSYIFIYALIAEVSRLLEYELLSIILMHLDTLIDLGENAYRAFEDSDGGSWRALYHDGMAYL